MAMQVCRQSLYPSTLSDDRANNPALSRDARDNRGGGRGGPAKPQREPAMAGSLASAFAKVLKK